MEQNTTNPLILWELQWISDHPQCYDSVLHQRAVGENIFKRYKIKGILDILKNNKDDILPKLYDELVDNLRSS